MPFVEGLMLNTVLRKVEVYWCWNCNQAMEHLTSRAMANMTGAFQVTVCKGCGEKKLERL